MSDNNYNGMLIVQRRISIIMIDDKIKRWNSSENVSGVLIGFSNKHSIAIIALDKPINTSPNNQDKFFAYQAIYNNNNKHIITLKLRYWDNDMILTHCEPIEETVAYMLDPTTDKSDKLVYCHICKKAVPMNRSIVTCVRNRHICCKNHIIPFDENEGIPDTKITKSLVEEFKRRFGFEIPCQQTCMLLLYEDCKDQRKQLKDQMMEEYCYNDLWKCKVCRNERSIDVQETRIEYLHKQLFIETAVDRVNDFKALNNDSSSNDRVKISSSLKEIVKNDSFVFSNETSFAAIDIILTVPSSNTSLQLRLFPNLNYFEVKEQLLSLINKRLIPNQIDIYKQLDDYCVLIVDEGDRNRGVLSVSDILNNDTIVLHNAYFNIGIPVKLSTCLYQNKDINNINDIGSKLNLLKKFYSSVRYIKNDYNNYYNAVMVAYIESNICSTNRQKLFKILYQQIRSVLRRDHHNSRLDDLLKRILQAAGYWQYIFLYKSYQLCYYLLDGKIWLTVTDFEVDVLTGGGWYSMLALSSRRILSKFIQKNPNMNINGLTIGKAVSSSFGLSDLNLFCDHYIGMEINAAPQIVTHLGLLPLSLNISCSLITYDNINENSLKHTLQTPISFDDPPYVNINLIDIRDSYYIIYPNKRNLRSEMRESDYGSNPLFINEDASIGKSSKISTPSNVTTQPKPIESKDNQSIQMSSNNSNSTYQLNTNVMSNDSNAYLIKDVKVLVYYVELNQISPITLRILNSFDDVVRSICQLLHINKINNSIVLHVLDSEGWSVEVASISQSGYVTIHELKEMDVITVRKLVERNVGPRMSIETVSQIEKNNPVLTKKYQNLSRQYLGIRKIRAGDGNCYYRAVIVGLLEQIVKSKDKSNFSQLINRLEQAQFSDAASRSNHVILLSYLKKASLRECFLTWEEVESKLLDDSVLFDKSLIVACRKLVAQYIVKHEDEEMNGLALKDWISSCYEVSSMREYCQKHVNTLGEDAEGPLVELGLLPRALGSYCTIVYLDHISGNDFTTITQQVDSRDVSEPLGNIHLLLKPGHFDLLYDKSTYIRHGRELLTSSLVQEATQINGTLVSQSTVFAKIEEAVKAESLINIKVDTNHKSSRSDINNISNDIYNNIDYQLDDIIKVYPNVSRHYIESGYDGYEAASKLSNGDIPTSMNSSSSKSRPSTCPSYSNSNQIYTNNEVSQDDRDQLASIDEAIKLKDKDIKDVNIVDLRKLCTVRQEMEKRQKESIARNKLSRSNSDNKTTDVIDKKLDMCIVT